MSRAEIPLFPLHTVLFPGGPLPLRIFEPRYLEMVSTCLRQGTGFGVCLIREGREVGEAAHTFEIGTLARITDWHMRRDGLLGIMAIGERCFRTCATRVLPNQLTVGSVELLAEEPECEVPGELGHLVDLLRRTLAEIGPPYADLQPRFDDASWVSCRLAELLPIGLHQKQVLLQIADPVQRLERLQGLLEGLDIC
jgi:uncharacterized protein